MNLLLIILICLVIMIVLIILVYSNRYRRVPPDQAMVIFGKGYGELGFTIIKGGGKFIVPILEEVSFLPLDVRTLDVSVPSVVTKEGVQLGVEAVAQVKISSDESLLKTAAEQLLHKSPEEINYVATRSLEGFIRGVCARLSVEEINVDRAKVAGEIQDVAVEELSSMGLQVVSFTIRDLEDTVGYLDALGKKQTAEVKRNAVIGEAEAVRDADIRSAVAKKDGKTAEAIAETQIAEAIRDKNLKIAAYEEEVKTKEADRDIAYSIQKSLREQELIEAQMGIKIREKEKGIELQEQEIARKEKELEATIRRPARAEKDREILIAEGKANAQVKVGQAEADVIQMKGKAEADVRFLNGEAEANVNKAKGLAQAEVLKEQGLAHGKAIEAKGLAEATAMDKKAEAWEKYGEAAIAQLIIDKLPEIADKLAPLENTEKIIIMGGERGPSALVGDGVRSMVELTSMVKGLTGLDIQKLIKGYLPQGETGKEKVKDAKILKKK